MRYYSCLKFLTLFILCNILEHGSSISMPNDRLSTMKNLHRKKRQLPLVFNDSTLFYFICGFGIPVDTDIDYESITSGVEFIAQLPQLPTKPSDLRTPSFYTINAGREFKKDKDKDKDINMQIRWEFYKALEVWANSIGLNGQACVLKTLCEVTQIPFDKDMGDLWHEIAHILFTPSLSTDDVSHPLSQKYLAASKIGLYNDCSSAFSECPNCCGPRPEPNPYKFNVNYHIAPITDKFWNPKVSEVKGIDPSTILRYKNEIEKLDKYDARCHSMVPRYSSQTYGWLPGYKLRFLQYCDQNIYDNPALRKVAKELVQHHLKGPKLMVDHCARKKLMLASTDHWKIV